MAATNRLAQIAFIAIVTVFAALSLGAAFVNPPWEAPDEKDHVLNVETLVGGHWYRIEPGAGLEPHQPPFYYLLLAAWQRMSGVESRRPDPVINSKLRFFTCSDHNDRLVVIRTGTPLRCTVYRHDLPRESADRTLVHLLRLPSVLFGIAVLLLTGSVARRLSSDPWTPVVAAAFVAGVHGFVFTSAIVNNDGLVTVLAAGVLLVSVVLVNRAPEATREAWPYAAALGGLVGLLLLTKLYGPAVILGVLTGIWLATRNGPRRAERRFDLLVITGATALVVTGWWLVQNQHWYKDPIALTTTHKYLKANSGLGAPRPYGAFKILYVDVPKTLYNTFFYNSMIGHLLWTLVLGSILCLAIPGARRSVLNKAHLVLLGSFMVSTIVSVSLVALQTSTFRASTGYIGLPALACLAASDSNGCPCPSQSACLCPPSGLS